MEVKNMAELKFEYIPIDDLTPYRNNAREHDVYDIDKIANSIKEFGFDDPIGVWGPDNIIVEGHGRQIAALELHLDKVPVIRLDHMTDDQRRDYAIRHNRTAELSSWDFTALEEEIAQLEIEGHDFSGLDFTFPNDTGGEPEFNAESSFKYKEQYAVTVLVKDEAEQREVYERLTGEGYECKVVCV